MSGGPGQAGYEARIPRGDVVRIHDCENRWATQMALCLYHTMTSSGVFVTCLVKG